nr:PREDICTED: proline-rich protein 20A-like [Equus przewalskii]XP_023475618.1 proline-rich protein 20A-like [Equus caballus]
MEEQRPPKRLRTGAPDPGGHRREPGRSGVEGEDPVEAHGPAEPGHPSKPFAYVKPMRCESPAFTEAARLAERGRGRHRARSPRTERGRRRVAGLPRGPSPQAGPGHMLGPDLHAELDLGDEPTHRMELEARQSWSFPFTDAVTVHVQGCVLWGHSPHTAVLGVRRQGQPDASGYWALMGSPASAVSPHIGFRASAGSALFFMQTSSGTYVYGVPTFFTHFAR